MTNQTIKIVNTSTGQETERPMNSKELEVQAKDRITAEAKRQAAKEKAEARSAAEEKLLALGLTTEDLKALLG